MHNELKTIIEQAWENRALLQAPAVQQAVRQVVELVDKGELRTAEPVDPAKSEWKVNEWVKKAVILYFPIQPMRKMEAGELEWYDKMELKHGYGELGVRVVPQAVARYGAYIAPGAILMPSYVNIGAYVDTGTMVDTWATVGSCAQIGKHVHLSGGVGIGGVLEPVQAAPVIIEDSCFIGSRCIVVEGAHVCREAVLGSNTVITGSTHIIDVTGLGGRPGQLPQAVPGGRIQRHVRADHRPAQGIHRQENLAERRPARLRRIGIDMIHRIEETTSTNDDARDAKYRHGDIVWAERQTAGRGQRGHKWSSAEGLNLTFSLVLEPRFLPAGEQFLLNEAVALALTDTFAQFGIAARIKWTNDIYAGDKKLVGILIEHSYSGQTLARTIVGIGINVNQTEFDPALPNPVSMAMVAGRTFDRGEVLEAFRRHIGIRYAQLELDERETLQRDYREQMYRLGERHTFRYPDGTPTEASIEGVRPTGELLLRHADGTLREYLFKEIEFVIAGK